MLLLAGAALGVACLAFAACCAAATSHAWLSGTRPLVVAAVRAGLASLRWARRRTGAPGAEVRLG